MSLIHPTAVIASGAEIAARVEFPETSDRGGISTPRGRVRMAA